LLTGAAAAIKGDLMGFGGAARGHTDPFRPTSDREAPSHCLGGSTHVTRRRWQNKFTAS
jgi:hypothetical protein